MVWVNAFIVHAKSFSVKSARVFFAAHAFEKSEKTVFFVKKRRTGRGFLRKNMKKSPKIKKTIDKALAFRL